MVLRYGHLAPDQLSKAAELVAQKKGSPLPRWQNERKMLILLVVREGLEPSTSAL
jgi:hypothetical protein